MAFIIGSVRGLEKRQVCCYFESFLRRYLQYNLVWVWSPRPQTNLSSAVKILSGLKVEGKRYRFLFLQRKEFTVYIYYFCRIKSKIICFYTVILLVTCGYHHLQVDCLNDTLELSNAVTWCFVLIFPARRMLMMFTSAWRITYWLLSASTSPSSGPCQTQHKLHIAEQS